MQKINPHKLIYHVRHKYFTFNNAVLLVAFLLAVGWLWGSLQVMQRNYALQREVDYKARELELTKLQKDSLELQKRYYQTNEYKEMAARESLGLVMPGEKVLIVPPNSDDVIAADKKAGQSNAVATIRQDAGNLEQWMNFLFGGYSQSMKDSEK